MKIFIEQPVQENKKNVFDKNTGQFLRTVPIKLTYPFPYGYILDTLAEDGDNLDCYVITDKKLETRSIVECEPIGMAEWFEDGEEDHKILAVLKGEHADITEDVKNKIIYFAEHFFDDQPDKKHRMGEFYGREKALELIKKSNVSLSNYKDRKYEIFPYDQNWPQQFAEHAKILKSIFADKAISIEHIGSTAVPGLAGKLTIDILIIVDDIFVDDQLKTKMEKAGYHALGEYVTKGALLFVKESNSIRYCNIHIFQKNRPHVQEMLGLRDYFRAHPEVVSEYSKLKADLATTYPNDYGEYRKYKDAWMNALKLRIKTEAGE